MDNSEYKVISNISIMRKRVIITILAFLLAVAFVFAIFYLVVAKKTDSWLDGTSGMARSSVFPFVYTSGDNIYVVDEDLTVSDIDNSTANVICDNNLRKVYYIYSPSSELYEYDLKSKTRVLLCKDVASFKLFKERTVIPYVGTDGALKLYSYNSKSSIVLREPVEIDPDVNLPDNALQFTMGKLSLVYFDNFNFDQGTANIKQWLSSGEIITLNEAARYAINPVIFSRDTAVSYYTKDGLCISPVNGDSLVVEGVASVVRTTDYAYGEVLSDPVSDFDASENIKYYMTGTSGGSLGLDIYSLNVTRSSVTGTKIAENVNSVINYSAKYSNLIYSVVTGEDELSIYSTKTGNKSSLIAIAPLSSTLYYDISSDLLYIVGTDNTVYTIDVFDNASSKFELEEGVGSIVPYFGKPFLIFYSKDYKTKTLILKQTGIENYPSSETRLYGKSDSIYLKVRNIQGKATASIDLVDGNTITRITNSCKPSCIVYDKKIENVIYFDKNTLYAVRNGVRTAIADYSEDVKPVSVLTD